MKQSFTTVTAANAETTSAVLQTVQENSQGIQGCSDFSEDTGEYVAIDLTDYGVTQLQALGASVRPQAAQPQPTTYASGPAW